MWKWSNDQVLLSRAKAERMTRLFSGLHVAMRQAYQFTEREAGQHTAELWDDCLLEVQLLQDEFTSLVRKE